MRRRGFLGVTASAASVVVAGCTGSSDDGTATDATPDGDPGQLVERFYAALSAGDSDEAEALVHPESPMQEGEVFPNQDALDYLAKAEVVVEETDAVETEGSATTVRATVRFRNDGKVRTSTLSFELRPADGSWRVWEATQESTETTAVEDGPTAVLERFYAAMNEGDTERAATYVHPDSPMRDGVLFPDEQVSYMERVDLTVDGAAIVHRNETSRVVRAVLQASSEGEERTDTITFELRKADGDWRIWQDRE
jgi:ketosteroid isomerase-like protein